MKKEFITYGKILRKEEFEEVKNSPRMYSLNKPDGGLWCSPTECEYGWKNFVEDNDFYPENLLKWTKFRVKENSKIFTIRTLADWYHLVKKYRMLYHDTPCIDFEALVKDGYQGLYATTDMVWQLRFDGHGTMFGLNGWDCESMVIFDFDIIEIKEEV